ncbi:hypothetical protein SAMN05880556_103214 [Azospirillum sp. RU38E]|nr:hypothetical protein SAMN05880556_103214 [Azospirillum sp. RU38E]SNS44669.1 hypothetical protein SAMN05880591_103214 [Azospirillum sp. RU37A]
MPITRIAVRPIAFSGNNDMLTAGRRLLARLVD